MSAVINLPRNTECWKEFDATEGTHSYPLQLPIPSDNPSDQTSDQFPVQPNVEARPPPPPLPNVHVPSLTEETIEQMVANFTDRLLVAVKIPASLAKNPKDPWVAKKMVKETWARILRDHLKHPGNYDRATPENINQIVSLQHHVLFGLNGV